MFPFVLIAVQLFWKAALVEGQSQIELQFTPISSSQIDNATRDNINLITNAAEQLVRPDYDKYPYVILEDQDKHNGILKLVYPEEGQGTSNIEIRIKIAKTDLKKRITVFPAGSRGFGFPVKQSFVVLRQNSLNQTMHYLNLAYIRRQGKQILIEWSTIDPKNFGKNRLDFELCRQDECDIPQWIFGTCPVVSNKCQLSVAQMGNSSLLSKWTWTADEIPSNPDTSNTIQSFNLNNLVSVAPVSNTKSYSARPFIAKLSLDRSQYSQLPIIPKSSPQNSLDTPKFQRKKRSKKTPTPEDDDPEIPNSLDLLLLKRSDENSSQFLAGEAHFQNSLLATRQVALENDDLECFECEKMGQFFDDYEEEPEFAKLVGNHARQQFNLRPPGNISGPDILTNYSSVPYIGYGFCNFTLADILKPKSREIDDLIEFLMASLRRSCEWSSENRLRSIFRSKMKLIEIGDDFKASVSPLSPLTKYKILTQKEFNSVMTAIFLAKYTQIYRQEESSALDRLNEQSNSSKPITPAVIGNGSLIVDHPRSPLPSTIDTSTSTLETISNATRVSKRMKFLTKLILSVTETLNKRFSQHLIKGLRIVLRILKDKFISLLQENLAVQTQPAQTDQGPLVQLNPISSANENLQDQHRVMALKEFILYGLGPMAKSGTSTEASFRSFSAINQKRTKALVQAYHNPASIS